MPNIKLTKKEEEIARLVISRLPDPNANGVPIVYAGVIFIGSDFGLSDMIAEVQAYMERRSAAHFYSGNPTHQAIRAAANLKEKLQNALAIFQPPQPKIDPKDEEIKRLREALEKIVDRLTPYAAMRLNWEDQELIDIAKKALGEPVK